MLFLQEQIACKKNIKNIDMNTKQEDKTMIIDFHSHILPEIDDGSKSVDMSLQMIKESYNQKINIVIATPHFYADSMNLEYFLKLRMDAYEKLQSKRNGLIYPQIYLGAEVAFFYGIGVAENIQKLCIQNTNIMLLELPFVQWNSNIINEIEQLLSKKIIIIIAHFERYLKFQRKAEYMERLLELPIYVQMNGESFLSWKTRKKAVDFVRKGKVHLLGSDSHNLNTRSQNLLYARRVIEKRLGNVCLNQIDKLGSQLLGLHKNTF